MEVLGQIPVASLLPPPKGLNHNLLSYSNLPRLPTLPFGQF